MKKIMKLLILAGLVLAVALSGCLGGDTDSDADGGNASGNTSANTSADGQNGSNGSDIAPLIAGAGGSGSSSGFADIMGQGTNISNLTASQKAEIIAQGKAEGVDITFNPDGSVSYVDEETGDSAIQNADGSWSIRGEDGTVGQIGGDWPDNEFTKQIPKPDFQMYASANDETQFGVVFTNATLDGIKNYAGKVKAAGFTIDADEQDMKEAFVTAYTYTAKNAAGYEVSVFSSMGVAGMTVTKV